MRKPSFFIRSVILAALCAAGLARADAVFDGTIGPNTAGTIRAGTFEIGQADGTVAGNNLFQSFSTFTVNEGEFATFSHTTPSIEHIIARITGVFPSNINGALQVRSAAGGVLVPTSADLWLINPNGIFIGDGAALDPQSAFVFSTANRLGFSNGDSFYSHDVTSSSVLSVAAPSSFGFLDQQGLPANVVPGGIVVAAQDPASANTPLFLSAITLVGSSIDLATPGVTILGNIGQPSEPGALPTPFDSTQLQAFNLRIASLGAGGVVDVDLATGNSLAAAAGSPLSAVSIRNSNILLSDNGIVPSSDFSVLADQLVIENSFIDSFALAVPTNVSLRAISELSLLGSVLQTSTASPSRAGDIRIDTGSYLQIGGQVSSQAVDLGMATGSAGNIIFGSSASLPLNSFILQEGRIQSVGAAASDAGDIIIRTTGDISLLGSENSRITIASLNNALGNAGDIVLIGDGIHAQFSDLFSSGLNISGPSLIGLAAGAGGLLLEHTSVSGIPTELGAGAEIALTSAGDITLLSPDQLSTITTGTNGNTDSGSIRIEAAGDLRVAGAFDLSSGNLFSDPAAGGSGGNILLSAQNIELEHSGTASPDSNIRSVTSSAGKGASIILSAAQNLTVRGNYNISSETVGTGAAGGVFLDAADLLITSTSAPVNLSSSSVGAGDAGIVELTASNSISLSGVTVSSVAASEGAAGTISLSSSTIDIDNGILATSTVANDINDTPTLISVVATQDLALSRSSLQSNTAGLAPAGQIRLASGNSITLDNVSIQSGSVNDGASGNIVVEANDIEIVGADTELLTNSQGASDAGDVNIRAANTLRFSGGGFIQTSAEGSGNAGTIRLFADQIVLNDGRIEGTSENAGGGDINIFGRDIRLDSDPSSGRIVFITTNSESSDAAGNGGSITLGSPSAPAELVLVRNSALSANANAGDGGRININADSFVRDASSIFLVTSTTGEDGSLEINSPEQDISAAVNALDVAILDATDLIQERCDLSPDDGSSLVIGGRRVITENYNDYQASPFEALSTAEVEAGSLADSPQALIAAAGQTGTFGTQCNYFLP